MIKMPPLEKQKHITGCSSLNTDIPEIKSQISEKV